MPRFLEDGGALRLCGGPSGLRDPFYFFFPRGIFGHSSRVRAACLQIGVKLGEERTDKLFGKPCRVFISEQSLETACYMYVRNMNPAAAVCILVAIVKYILT